MDSKYHGRFVYRELFLGIDMLFASVGDINRSAEWSSLSAYLLLAFVFVYPFKMINGDKFLQGFPKRITLEDIETQVQYAIKGVAIMATIVACHPRP